MSLVEDLGPIFAITSLQGWPLPALYSGRQTSLLQSGMRCFCSQRS